MGAPCVVLDTNIVLDLLIFNDPRCAALKEALHSKAITWIATQVMRGELERVLAYTHLQPRMAFYQITAEQVLAQFDVLAELREVAARCQFVCTDADDQKFIDLAAEHCATLVSKDKAVLRLRKRLAALDAVVTSQWLPFKLHVPSGATKCGATEAAKDLLRYNPVIRLNPGAAR